LTKEALLVFWKRLNKGCKK